MLFAIVSLVITVHGDQIPILKNNEHGAGAVGICNGQTFCSNFLTDRDTCASQHIPSLPSVSNPFTTLYDVFNTGTIFGDLTSVCTCANVSPVIHFYSCLVNATDACTPQEWKKAFQTNQQIQAALTYLCDNFFNIDFPCILARNDSLSCCIANNNDVVADFSTPDSYTSTICRAARVTEMCIRRVYATCNPPQTATVLGDFIHMQIPAACNQACEARSPVLPVLYVLGFMVLSKGKSF